MLDLLRLRLHLRRERKCVGFRSPSKSKERILSRLWDSNEWDANERKQKDGNESKEVLVGQNCLTYCDVRV